MGGNLFVDTDISLGKPVEVDATVEVADAVGINFEGSVTVGGGYNGYSASYGVGGVSYSWSNVNNSTDELYPGMRSTWTWKLRSLDPSLGLGKFEVRYFGGETSNFGKMETKQKKK